jgi:putative FmdB family regulatory protein
MLLLSGKMFFCVPRSEIHTATAHCHTSGTGSALNSVAEVGMPIYEYLCKDCSNLFERNLTLAAHEREPITCPKCESKNVEQELTRFYAVTSKKSA